MIPKRLLQQFKEIYQKEFKVEISDDEALKMAVQFLELYRVVHNITPEALLK